MKVQEDTIAAIASGVGGSIAIIRLSGPDALPLAQQVWSGSKKLGAFSPRTLQLGELCDADGTQIDRAMAVYMPEPRSYTGEDIVEIHTHGGAMITRLALRTLLNAGARHADPGEFTKRAFINGKMDLTQAEAVADVINAHSEMALHTANRQLNGHLGRKVDEILAELTEVLAEIEVRMDFVEDDLNWKTTEELTGAVDRAIVHAKELLSHSEEGQILRNGIRLAIAGAPNAGKSSLMNLILGHDRAIVTDIPGTTRDTLEELAHIRSIPVHITDTAGLRETDDIVEQHGVKRSYTSIQQSQIVLRLLDATRALATQPIEDGHLEGKKIIYVANKIDLNPTPGFADELNAPVYELSAATGGGLATLLDAIEEAAWGHPHHQEPDVAINSRHSALLQETLDQLALALPLIPDEEFELLAINLRTAIDAVGKITGQTVAPDILDYIFDQFCIGK
ncbi:tRNA uridine-5-carboxymethylaminomethyl(34) synthesis GTPase MnmE [bacterium M21]|nr:tRNA uridine-5-carboxymethylaminomethyl(34) synthesis GTPase MnmE [bacterium M21]